MRSGGISSNVRVLFPFLFPLALAGCTAGSAKPGPPLAQVKSVVLPNGVRLEYAEQGDPAGIPVILLHGYTDSRRSWDRVLPLLPGSIRVFALSQRGHGESDKPATGYRPVDLSTDVVQFMNAVGVSNAVIVGHSMGSVVGRRLALDHPDRVSGLVLEAAFATLKGSPIMEGFWTDVIEPLEDPIPAGFVEDFQRSTLTRPVPEWFFDLVVSESRKAPIQVWKGVIDELRKVEFAAETTVVKAPTLILWGDRDSYAPREEQELLKRSIPGSQLIVYQGTGHGMHWEEPERYVRDLTRFVTSVGQSPSIAAR
jgi:pimeloyl-ACP methyl ester carboxylesterase